MKNTKYIAVFLIATLSYSEIVPDGGTNVYVEKSKNSVEIINISTPTKRGVSDSTFSKFSVDKAGAVINNATGIGRSHIAGLINPNKNLETPARLALFRVTSTNKSELKGVLEALTKNDLDVVLSNKNGITLDGAKFLNIHDMTLTTGEVSIKNEEIENINVGDGLIVSIDELNVSNINKVNILSKVAKLEKDVIAKNIEVATGRNVYNLNGENVEIVKTYEGEIGVPISAEILGSVYGENVKIIATKSGIGAKSITADTVKLDSQTQAKVEKILSNNTSIKVEEDFNNTDKIIANKNLEIEARNITNDGSLLISDNVNLKATEKINNINGGLIHGELNLNVKSKNLSNVGKVESFGDSKVEYYDIETNEKIDDIEKWESSHKETYKSYNAFKSSSTNEAKENALRSFYDEKVHLDQSEFDWRVYKDYYEAGENKKREGTKGKFVDELSPEERAKVKEANKKAMYSDPSDNYKGSIELGKVLEGKVESKNKKTKFSVLSGNNINIDVENVVDNKDGHIIANEDNTINSKIFNNSSSIDDKSLTIQDGFRRVNFDGSFNCVGLVSCTIIHNAEYLKQLDNKREVFVKALPSYLKGNNIQLNSKEVNFKAYKEDESKKALREEDEIYTNHKEEVVVNGKKIEYSLENEPIYTGLKYFYSNPYFLDNIKYNNKYDPKEFSISNKIIEENERENNKVSNITINAENLNIEAQNFLFNNIKLSSNNVLIKDSKVGARSSLDISNSENVNISSSDVIAEENLKIGAKEVNIKASKVASNGNFDIDAEKVNILNSVDNVVKEKAGIKEELQISNKSDIFAKNLNINAKETNIKDSDVFAENLDVKGKLNVGADILTQKTSVKKSGLGYSIDNENIKQSARGSNIVVVENANIENLKLEGSRLEANNLEAKKVDVNAIILQEKVKVNESSFKLVGASNGNLDSKELQGSGKVDLFSHTEVRKDNVLESNARSGLLVKNNTKIDKLSVLSSDVDVNNANINKVESNTTKLTNSINENIYKGNLSLSSSAGINGASAKVGIGIENVNTKGNEVINENSSINLGGNSIIKEGAKFVSTDLKYDKLNIDSKEVVFDANKDTKDVTKNITNVDLGVSVEATSPIISEVYGVAKDIIYSKDRRIDKISSKVVNGLVSTVDYLANNIKDKSEKDILDKVSIGGEVSLNVGNVNDKKHEEIVKNGSLTGNTLNFNNNKEVKFVSTSVNDTTVNYNNVDKVTKEVKVANNSQNINEVSVGVGVSANLDTKQVKVVPGTINLSGSVSNVNASEKVNKENVLTNTKENFKDVKEATFKGVKSNNASLEGNVRNLTKEDIKDEKLRTKLGLGGSGSLLFNGVPVGGNIKVEAESTRKEVVNKNDVDLSKLKVEKEENKELEANNHEYKARVKAGTNGLAVKVKVNDDIDLELEANSKTIDAIKNPSKFKKSVNLVKDEVVNKVKEAIKK